MPDAVDLVASGTQVGLLLAWLSSLTWGLFGLAALALLFVVSGRTPPVQVSDDRSEPRFDQPPAVLLFDGEELVDATEAGWALLAGWDRADTALPIVARVLADVFGPSLPDDLRAMEEGGRLRREADSGRAVLEAETFDGAVRLVVTGWRPEPDLALRLHIDALRHDADLVRQVASQSPIATWITDASDHVIWRNEAFDEVAERMRRVIHPALDGHAARAIQPDETIFGIGAPAVPTDRQTRRVSVPQSTDGQTSDARSHRFDVTSIPTDTACFHYALDAEPLAAAETGRAGIVRSLSLAFAQLGDGVAVFDVDRRLVAYNPAFADITGASLDVLGDGPRLSSLLDSLHNAAAIPEPPNYQAWRASLLAIGTDRGGATYDDTWAVPDGRMLRVAGRGLPDGGLVLIVHDATQEIAQAHHARTRGDMALAALSSVDLPVLLIDAEGRVAASTPAYEAGRRGRADDPSRARRTEVTELECWAQTWSLHALRTVLATPPRRPATIVLAPVAEATGPASVRVQGLPGGGRMFTFVRGWPGQAAEARPFAPAGAQDLPSLAPTGAVNGIPRSALLDGLRPAGTLPARRDGDPAGEPLDAELTFRTRRHGVERPAIATAPAHIV